ncbi:hypothetical protein [Streptomyces sp. NPDC055140]
MTDALTKAEAAAREAAVDTAAVQVALAAVELAKLAQTQQQAPAAAPARQEFDATKWLVIGGVVVGGAVAVTALAMAAALLAVAVAVGGVCATACLLVLRSMWSDIRKG